MKHVKLFEGFINEAEKLERGKYHPEVETYFSGKDGDDRLRTAFGVPNSFRPNAEYAMEQYKKIKPANIKKAIKEVDKWLVIPRDRLKLKKFLAMFKTKNAKNLANIDTYVMLTASQKKLERQYKVRGFVARAEVFSQIATGVKKMKLDQNNEIGTVTLKDIEKISKSLHRMHKALIRSEEVASNGEVEMLTIPILADAIDTIDKKVIPESKKLKESSVVETYNGATGAGMHRKAGELDKYVDQLKSYGNDKGGAVKRACNKAIKQLQAAIKIMAPMDIF